jgi:tetratricopeptide (TPR) repeat protein
MALIGGLLAAAVQAEEGVDALNRRMMELYGAGHYEEALPLAAQIVAGLEKSTGPGSREVASALNNEAELYNKLHRYAEAEPLYKRSLAIRRAVLGPDHPDTVKSLDRLAEIYHAEGKDVLPVPQPQSSPAPHPAAAPMPRPVQPAPLRALGVDTNHVSQLNQQAIELTNQGRFAEALPLATQAAEGIEKALGPDNVNVAIVIGNLAQVHLRLDQFDKAEALYKRSLAILEKQHGGYDKDLAIMLANLADLSARQNRYPEAESYYRRCIPLMEKAFGADHANVTAMISNFANIERTQGKDPDAEPLLKDKWQKTAQFGLPRSRTGSVPAAPPREVNPLDEERARGYDDRIFVLISQKKFAEAEPLAKEQLALLEKIYGPDNLAVAITLDTLANIYRNLGRSADAEPLAKRSQAIRDANKAIEQINR